MKIWPSLPALAVTCSLAAPGCGGDSAGGAPPVTTRDSAGITIIENPSPADSARNDWWRIEPTGLDIGGIDVEEQYAIYRVTDALRLSDDRIAVASSGSDDVRFFDPSGTYLSTSGRSGDGPGEYENVNGLERGQADSLLVIDATARRVSVLDPAGEFVRTFDIGNNAFIPRIVGRFADGSLLAAPAIALPPDGLTSSKGITRPPFVLIRIPPSGTAPDTLGEFPGAERVINVSTNSSGELTSISILIAPFSKSPTFAVHGDEVWVGTQDDAEIRAYGSDGALHRIIRTGLVTKPVTEQLLDAQFESQLRNAPEDQREEMRKQGRNRDLPHGEHVPPYGEILTGASGDLWVADYDDPTGPANRWTVYDPSGAVLARIALPDRFRPFDIGDDWILGRWTDEYDVEHVQSYRIVKQ